MQRSRVVSLKKSLSSIEREAKQIVEAARTFYLFLLCCFSTLPLAKSERNPKNAATSEAYLAMIGESMPELYMVNANVFSLIIFRSQFFNKRGSYLPQSQMQEKK